MEETSGFWADAIGLAASPVAIAAGIAKGSYDAATGSGAFDEGFHAAADPIITSARKFHHAHLSPTSVSTFASIVTFIPSDCNEAEQQRLATRETDNATNK